MKLVSERLDDFLPVRVRRQAPTRRAPDTVFTIQLYVQRIKNMTTGADRDADAIVERRLIGGGRIYRTFRLRLV